jgi:hypothetical protein
MKFEFLRLNCLPLVRVDYGLYISFTEAFACTWGTQIGHSFGAYGRALLFPFSNE